MMIERWGFRLSIGDPIMLICRPSMKVWPERDGNIDGEEKDDDDDCKAVRLGLYEYPHIVY